MAISKGREGGGICGGGGGWVRCSKTRSTPVLTLTKQSVGRSKVLDKMTGAGCEEPVVWRIAMWSTMEGDEATLE